MEPPVTPGTEYSILTDSTLSWISPFTIVPGSRDKVETHMSLAGGPYGRLSIPDEMHEAWLRVYTAELKKNKHSLFFAERRTPIFRMHFDLDFCETEPVGLHTLTAIARECRRVFRPFFPTVPEDAPMWRCVLLVASPKPATGPPVTEDDDGVRVKSGCHMLWPWMYVNQVQALQLRANVVDTLVRTWPPRPPTANSYDDVVDRTVLKSNGLRMMGSDKASRCKKCNTPAARNNCKPCKGTGVIAENRPYTLSMVLNATGEPDVERLEAWKNDLFKCVRFTSIRSSRVEHSAGFVVPSHAVVDACVKMARKKAGRGAAGTAGAVATPREAMGLLGSVTIDPSSRIFSEMQSFLTTHTCGQWSGLRISHLYIQHNLGRYTVNVTGPGSSFCTHVGRAHTSSTVYFTVERDGVRQRCFSPKVHTDGTICRKYVGPPAPLTQWLLEAMFGSERGMSCGGDVSDNTLGPVIASTADEDAILAKSAAYTRKLSERVAAKRKMATDEECTLSVLGKKTKVKGPKVGDRGADTPHPVFTNKTCGEVEKMSSWEIHVQFTKLRTQRIADTAKVHAAEVSCNGAVPVNKKTAPKRSGVKKAAGRGRRGSRMG